MKPPETRFFDAPAGAIAGGGWSFNDRGEHELKGVPGRWPLFAVEAGEDG